MKRDYNDLPVIFDVRKISQGFYNYVKLARYFHRQNRNICVVRIITFTWEKKTIPHAPEDLTLDG